MEYIIFFTKDGDEYLVRFPSSFAFDGYELSVPAGEETPESVHDYLREQIQNTIDGGDLDENIAEILQECLDNCRFEEEISCEGQKAWSRYKSSGSWISSGSWLSTTCSAILHSMNCSNDN